MIRETNQNKINLTGSELQLEEETRKLLEVREKANDQVAIIFSFTSGWLGGWHMSSEPITKQS